MAPLRWGIVSAGKISHDFVTGLSTLPSDEHSVVAIAARDKKRAEQFANLHEIPNALGNYEDLAESKEIDVVYIGALNPQHFEIGMMMLEHGKHILVEKPLCMNEKQAKKLITYAERKKLFLMEAVWSRFFPAYQYVRKQIASGVLGDIEEVNVSFGFDLMDVDRMQKKELGGGTVLDLGIYVIQLSQWAFQEPPKVIKATGELNADGVDLSIDGELQYSGGRVAKIQTSARKELDNKAIIKGSKGQITLPNFWCPTSIIDIDGKQKEWVLPKGKHKTNFPNSEGLRYEAEEVRKCILEGKLQSEHMSHNESLLVAHIEDSIRKQVGVIYPEDY
ncbi:trans-1,2-dihydrobenzene-1,2-diol dehydrogenase-like [Episyrphus balteatus]|uniref:trans-1,2-dihydrobenzene-1,2-diol dehydrogenase-like n=1 Tax=Episyrphus balteatus TaxID=286459 RepID=UPI0024864111|nr:trans-1,2-dihydrobenzene-1,2-diol dehydrogenase-like [Episyrphus balteatus]